MPSDALMQPQQADLLTMFATGLTTPFIRLFTGGTVPTPLTVLSQLPEPVGTWYAAVAAVYADVFVLGDGSIELRTQAVQFNYSGSSPAETITGWAVVDTAGPTLLHARRLDSPVTMGNSLNAVVVQPSIVLPPINAS